MTLRSRRSHCIGVALTSDVYGMTFNLNNYFFGLYNITIKYFCLDHATNHNFIQGQQGCLIASKQTINWLRLQAKTFTPLYSWRGYCAPIILK